MQLKLIAPIIVLLLVVVVAVSACTTTENQVQTQAGSSTTTPSGQATVSATPTAKPIATTGPTARAPTIAPTATPTNTPATPTPVYTIFISGPASAAYGARWTATVYRNGVAIPESQLTGRVTWFINGEQSRGDDQTTWGGSQLTMTHDANGLAGAPFQVSNTITATYNGITSPPLYYYDSELAAFPTPIPFPTATPFPTTPRPTT